MIKQIILYELIIKFKGTKLEENNNTATMFAVLHNVCIFSNYKFKDFKIINLISISITMGEHRYNKFENLFVNQ